MGWAEEIKPAPSIEDRMRAVDLENDMARIGLVCHRSLREARALPADEAATYLGDAIRCIEKIASRQAPGEGEEDDDG